MLWRSFLKVQKSFSKVRYEKGQQSKVPKINLLKIPSIIDETHYHDTFVMKKPRLLNKYGLTKNAYDGR